MRPNVPPIHSYLPELVQGVTYSDDRDADHMCEHDVKLLRLIT